MCQPASCQRLPLPEGCCCLPNLLAKSWNFACMSCADAGPLVVSCLSQSVDGGCPLIRPATPSAAGCAGLRAELRKRALLRSRRDATSAKTSAKARRNSASAGLVLVEPAAEASTALSTSIGLTATRRKDRVADGTICTRATSKVFDWSYSVNAVQQYMCFRRGEVGRSRVANA